MNPNTAQNQPEQTMTDPFSGVTFRVIDGGKSNNPQISEFKPVNPHGPEAVARRENIENIRTSINKILNGPDILEHASAINSLISEPNNTPPPKEDRWGMPIEPVRPTKSPRRISQLPKSADINIDEPFAEAA